MSIILRQQPYSLLAPASTETVFTCEAQNIVLNETGVKFICEVYVHRTYYPMTSIFPVATLKTSPNAAGVGIFDISPVTEAYVNVSQEGRKGITTQNPNQNSTFKGTPFESAKPHAIHLIDKYCTNQNNMTWYQCKFRLEYLNPSTGRVELDEAWDRDSVIRLVYNGVLGNTDPITYYNDWYFYNMQDVQYENGSGDYLIRGADGSEAGGRFITNMPEKQKIRDNEYATVAFFNCIRLGFLNTMPANSNRNIDGIVMEFYNEDGVVVQSDFTSNVPVNGGKGDNCPDLDASAYWIYFGHGLANLKGRGGTYPSTAVGYKVFASNGEYDPEKFIYERVGREYDYEIVTDDCFGFKPVRLTWQNKLGAWDYYTFSKKSKKTVKSKRKTYEQLAGTWNEAVWRPKDYLGGQKVYTNVAKESLALNTDYVDEATATWLEELFTSSQVYILSDFSDTNPVMNFGSIGQGFAKYIHKYIEPVVVTDTKYVKKTVANDGLIQYSLKIEKSKPLNIQRA